MISRRKLLVGSAVASVVAMTASLAWAELPKLAQKDTYKVGFAQVESNNPWHLAETQSMKDEAAKLGYGTIILPVGSSVSSCRSGKSTTSKAW